MILDDFIIRAALAGLGIAAIAGVMGCFIVWRRMAYFGDSLAHSAMLGIALGIGLGLGASIGVILICGVFALLLLILERQGTLASDTLLGILAHGSLSLGIVLVSLLDLRVDLHGLLFGDILTVTASDIGFIFGVGLLVLVLIGSCWDKLILVSLSPAFARAEGIRTGLMQLIFLAGLTLVVAVSVRLVGVLLVTSLLIIPAATSRLFATSPERMALGASLVGMGGVLAGLVGSFYWDIPTGPAMVVFLSFGFGLAVLARRFFAGS